MNSHFQHDAATKKNEPLLQAQLKIQCNRYSGFGLGSLLQLRLSFSYSYFLFPQFGPTACSIPFAPLPAPTVIYPIDVKNKSKFTRGISTEIIIKMSPVSFWCVRVTIVEQARRCQLIASRTTSPLRWSLYKHRPRSRKTLSRQPPFFKRVGRVR